MKVQNLNNLVKIKKIETQKSNIAFERAMIICNSVRLALLIALITIGAVSCSTIQSLKPTKQETPVLAPKETVEATSEPTNETTHDTVETVETEEIVKKATLYDTLTAHEIMLLETTIQHEVGNFSKEYKTYVAELIYNRLISENFPDTIHDVLFQKGQFQGIAVWSNSGIIPDEETKDVVKEVFSSEAPSHSCTFYYNPALSDYESVIWFENSNTIDYVFSHTETSWGTEYTTRFFELKE